MHMLKNKNKTPIQDKLNDLNIWYKHPRAMTAEDWEKWEADTLKKYPIQYPLRSFITIGCSKLRRMYYTIRYNVKHTISPCFPLVRAELPRVNDRHLCGTLLHVNFAIIKQFKKGYDESNTTGTYEHTPEFKAWYDEAYHWVTVGRDLKEEELAASFPEIDLKTCLKNTTLAHEELYAAPIAIEKFIQDTDTYHLTKLIEHRDKFWD